MRLFGVSRDSPWTHIAWKQVLDVSFPLLSDWNADAVRALDNAQDFRGLRDVNRRSVVLVDEDCTVRASWRYGNSELPDVDELLAAARSL